MRTASIHRFGWLIALAASDGSPSIAGAASSSYTVTDLGAGTATLSNPTGADATLTAPDGKTIYAFPRTDNRVADADLPALTAKFPALTNAPVDSSWTYGNPNNAYSYYTPGTVFLNQDGIAVATNHLGVEGHETTNEYMVDIFQRQANGTFTAALPPTALYLPGAGMALQSGYTGGDSFTMARAVDLNHSGLLLTLASPWEGVVDYHLVNLNSPSFLDLQTLLPGYHIDYSTYTSLDDQGRILIYADSASDVGQIHAFLLTPDGVSSTPIATPEPSTLATFGLGAAALAWRHRARRHGAI